MNVHQERERAALEATRRSPFWVCLLVFLALAIEGGARLARQIEQRQQLGQMQLNQAATVGRLSAVLAQAPQTEAKLQSISMDLIQVARTNALAAQRVREFNISWTPPSGSAADGAAARPATVPATTNNPTK